MVQKLYLGNPEFLFAFSDIIQLENWFNEHLKGGMKGLAFVGRSNVGKSSFINALFDKKIAKTSKTPGRTQAVNIFRFYLENDTNNPVYLFDLPGYGFAEVSKEMARNWKKLMTLFFSLLPPEIIIMNIQDARRPNQETDRMFYSFIKDLDNEVILILNKIDKVKTQKENHELKNIMKEMLGKLSFISQIVLVSAETKMNIDKIKKSLFQSLIGDEADSEIAD